MELCFKRKFNFNSILHQTSRIIIYEYAISISRVAGVVKSPSQKSMHVYEMMRMMWKHGKKQSGISKFAQNKIQIH